MEGNKGHTGLIVVGALLGGAYLLLRPGIKRNVIEPRRLNNYKTLLRVNMPAVRFKGDDVEFDVYVQNPNSYPLTVKAVVGDAWLTTQAKRYKLGNVKRYGDTVIQPLGETKYTFKVRMRFLGLLPYFTDMVEGRIKNQFLSFEGTININGRPWPIKEGYKIS